MAGKWLSTVLALLVCVFAIDAAPAPQPLDQRARILFGTGVEAVAQRDPFAVVNIDIVFEGSRLHGQALLRRYPFGWQLLELSDGAFRRCDLLGFGVPPAFVSALSIDAASRPPRANAWKCPVRKEFAQPTSDEVAVRALFQSDSVYYSLPYVFIDGAWALTYLGTGTQVEHRIDGHWKFVHGSGGFGDDCWMIAFAGVPAVTAHRLFLKQIGVATAALDARARARHCKPSPNYWATPAATKANLPIDPRHAARLVPQAGSPVTPEAVIGAPMGALSEPATPAPAMVVPASTPAAVMPTPASAPKGVLYHRPVQPAASIAERAKVVFSGHAGAIAVREPFAVVNVDLPNFEGSRLPGQALFRLYGFGWQMIDLAAGAFPRCELLRDEVPAASLATLQQNDAAVPSAHQPFGGCDAARALTPVSDDEEAVRALLQAELDRDHVLQYYRRVVIDGDWAYTEWAGGGGGPLVLHKSGGMWASVHGTGGQGSACWMHTFAGVPATTAHRLALAMYGERTPFARTAADVRACM